MTSANESSQATASGYGAAPAAGEEPWAKPIVGTPVRSVGEAKAVVRLVDWILLFTLFLVLLSSFHIHAMLTMGDWDFWIDWKDRRLWPTVVPIVLVTFVAAGQYFFWEKFRMPIGGTIMVTGLLCGEWINRYVNFWGWTYFPINLVFPTALVAMGIFIDCVLLLTRSYLATAVVGALGWGLLLYPSNWVMIAPYHLPVEKYGTVMSLADLIGFEYIRTSTPEYIRMVERGTLRTFGKDVVPVSAFFSGFISMLVYFMWLFVGKWYSTTRFIGRT